MKREAQIPCRWRTSVIAILQSEDESKILITFDGRNRWQARFPDAWPHQLWEALSAALADDHIVGHEINDMAEGYETWEFFFTQQGVKLYGKVGLHPAGIKVKIYSAHPPLKGDTL